jgi:hypothetical protein
VEGEELDVDVRAERVAAGGKNDEAEDDAAVVAPPLLGNFDSV